MYFLCRGREPFFFFFLELGGGGFFVRWSHLILGEDLCLGVVLGCLPLSLLVMFSVIEVEDC